MTRKQADWLFDLWEKAAGLQTAQKHIAGGIEIEDRRYIWTANRAPNGAALLEIEEQEEEEESDGDRMTAWLKARGYTWEDIGLKMAYNYDETRDLLLECRRELGLPVEEG